jgi:hypothetical protein
VLSMGAGALRLLLLALLSIGVMGMHTVGHSSDHSSWDALSSHAAGAAMADAASWLTDAPAPCDGDCGAAVAVTVAVRPGPGSDPVPGGTGLVIVCLAVLGGLGALAMLASALAGRHIAAPRTASHCRQRPTRAGPERMAGYALRLVDVAVLRT